MEFTGQANAKELAEVFQMVTSSSRPGQLTVASGERRLSFYFSPDGVTLLSDGGLKSTELAAELVAEKTITHRDSAAALAEQERTGGYFGEILCRQDAVDQDAVQDLVLRQIQGEILSLCTWEHGTFEFVEGNLSPEVRDQFRFATSFAFDPQQLLMDAARRLDEWRRIATHIPSDDAILTRSDDTPAETSKAGTAPAAPEAPCRAPAVGPMATAVSVLVDGTRTVGEIVRGTHFSRFEVLQCLAEFIEKGFIRLAEVEELLDAARSLARQRDYPRAAGLYLHVAARRPTDAVMPLKAGQLYERLGQTAEALAAYRMAVERLLASDMPGQAVGVIDVMKTLSPDDLFALETSVKVRLATGDVAQAGADARHLTGLFAAREETEKAIRYAGIVADLAPEDTDIRRTLADLFVKAGKSREAADELQRLAIELQKRRRPARLRRVLREIEALDPGRPKVRRALRATEATGPRRARRWGRVAAISAAGGLIAAAVTFAVVYEIEGRQAYRSVKRNAEDLTRHRGYDEAAALFAEVARTFRYSSVADDAERSRRDVLAEGRRYAAQRVRAGRLAADRGLTRLADAAEGLVDGILAKGGEATVWADNVLTAAALYHQARRLESQAKYADARVAYAKLIHDHPDVATFLNVELPLTVESVPLGAKVFINGKEVGRTPLLVRHPPFAAHRIVIQQPGFEPYEATLEPSAKVSLGAELPRRPQWVFRTGGGIESGVACDGERVVFGSRDGHVYAVSAGTGRLIWKFDTGALGDVTCSPVIAGGMVFAGSHDHCVYALDVGSGRQRWRFRTGRLVRSTPCVADEGRLVCVGSSDRSVYALSADTGRLRWRFRTDGAVSGTAAAHGDVVLVGSQDRRLYALETSDGTARWRFEAGGSITSSPVVADGAVYFGATDGYVYALDGTTGHVRWSFKTGGPIEGAPCVSRSVVYVGSSDGAVYALDRARGLLRWKYRTNGSIRGAPAIRGRFLFVGSDDHALHVLALETGALCWKAKTGGPVAATPVIVGNLLFVGSKDRNLYAFRLSDQVARGAGAARQ